MKNNYLDNLFETLEDSFDVKQTPRGHEKRFLDKLNKSSKKPKKKFFLVKAISVAAMVLLIVTAGNYFFQNNQTNQADLASVSTEMEKTQSFFTSTINQELETLKNFKSEDTKAIVNDALEQINILEKDYNKLKIDLVKSGQNKQVIYAMILNYQKRIELLQEVIKKIEEIKLINKKSNENIL